MKKYDIFPLKVAKRFIYMFNDLSLEERLIIVKELEDLFKSNVVYHYIKLIDDNNYDINKFEEPYFKELKL